MIGLLKKKVLKVKKLMKKLVNIVWGIWCAFTTFISPVWVTMIYLNITGLIYMYDYSMDEGTAIPIGLFLLVLWLLIVALPIIGFIRYVYRINKRNLLIFVPSMMVLAMVCVVACGWDIVHFLVA